MPNSIRIVQIRDGPLQIEIDEIHEVSPSGPGNAIMGDNNMLGFRIKQVNDGTVVAFSGPRSKNIADKLASSIEEFINGYYYPANEVDLDQFTVRKLDNEDICIVNGDHEVIISSEDVAELIRELGRLPRSHA
ncbi:hypothetical protein [Methanothrix sp.]|uniref:hypothetical protein n=1 Tax=Methanothrix sp. TaxID=90426 RepID=UPI003BB64DD9